MLLGRPTLRDLCLEDKRRVKNLVEEVARLGTEKERLELEMVKERAALQSLLDNLNTKHHLVVEEKKNILIACPRCVFMWVPLFKVLL